MAYTTGTAANYKDLLSTLATFAAANGWVIKEQTTDKVFLMGTGLAGLDEIYGGVSTYEDVGNSYYNWELHGSWGYRAGRDFSAMPRSSGDDKAFAYFWNAAIPYWMVANGRRIIVVAKVSTVYQHVHLGLLTPPATDAQYPYPMLLGGCGQTKARSYSNTTNSAYWNCSSYSYMGGRLCRPGGIWSDAGGATNTTDVANIVNPSFPMNDSIIKSPGGEFLLEPLMAVNSTLFGIYGSIEGLFRVSGYQNSAENIITVNGVNYMVFPDCHRNTYADYCALRLN